MALSYEPLWQFLNEIHLSKMEFAQRVEISNATLAKLGKNEPVTLTVIERICSEFNCNINDIVVHLKDNTTTVPIELLKTGTIVSCQCYPFGTTVRSQNTRTRRSASINQPCVVIGAHNNDPSHILIAPLNLNEDPETILDIPFNKSVLNEQNVNGYIQLSKMGRISSHHIEKILGKIPRYIISDKICDIIKNLAPILISNNIIHTSFLENFSLIPKQR